MLSNNHKYNENTLVLLKWEPGRIKNIFGLCIRLLETTGAADYYSLEFVMVLQHNLCVVKA